MERVEQRQTIISPSGRKLIEQFETGIALTLKNAWLHVEAMQSTDIPLMVESMSKIFDFAANYPTSVNNKKATNVMVIYFAMGLMKWIEDVGESRVMPLIMEHRIFVKLVQHLRSLGNCFSEEDLLTAAEALALICETEEFQTHSDDFVRESSEKEDVVALGDEIFEGLIKRQDSKRKYRPLLDFLRDCAREIGRK